MPGLVGWTCRETHKEPQALNFGLWGMTRESVRSSKTCLFLEKPPIELPPSSREQFARCPHPEKPQIDNFETPFLYPYVRHSAFLLSFEPGLVYILASLEKTSEMSTAPQSVESMVADMKPRETAVPEVLVRFSGGAMQCPHLIGKLLQELRQVNSLSTWTSLISLCTFGHFVLEQNLSSP